MDKTTHSDIPNSDPDKKLSEAFKKMLESRDQSSKSDDPLMNLLFNARDRDIDEREEIPVQGKDSSWKAIHQTIQKSDSTNSEVHNKTTIKPLHTRRQWLKVAAAIVLIAFSVLLLIQQFSTPDQRPVAEVSSSVQTIELADGSSVTLRPNSHLYELTDSENERAYSLSGEAVFDVVSSPDRVFTVQAGSGRVVVTGTRFNLNDRDETARVYLFEGSVRFETGDGSDSVDLEPGEASEIDESMRVRDPFQFESDLVTGWTQNRLTFRDRRAGSVMDELEFHYNIQIIAPSDVRSESLGGTIQLDSAEQSLNDLATVLGGSFEATGNDTYEFSSAGN